MSLIEKGKYHVQNLHVIHLKPDALQSGKAKDPCQYYTCKLPIAAGHCPGSGYTDRIVCNIDGEVHLTSNGSACRAQTDTHTETHMDATENIISSTNVRGKKNRLL